MLDKGTKGAGEAVKAGKVWLWREVRHLISRTKARKEWVCDYGGELGDKRKLCWLHLLSESGGEVTC